ncbi:hypothetical protein B0H13DRAFT_2655956 [Mycena leptocephala]|nr:hypothetical protein B0H13DRAFT_2655956 [Mycena leptocephala]
MDTDMGMDYRDAGLSLSLHTDSKALRVAIITGVAFASLTIPLSSLSQNCHPKIDGSTITLAHLLQHLATLRARGMLLGPEIGMQG